MCCKKYLSVCRHGIFFDDSDYKGIYVIVTTNALIENNVVDTVGLSGIQFSGNDIVVQKNFVNYFCNRVHDNGGIYTYVGGTDASPGATYTNRIVKSNIIMNGIGAPDGTNNPAPYMAGIYCDGRTMNVKVLDNTIINCKRNGIHCNNPSNITIQGNTLHNNWRDISFTRWSWGSINNLNIKKNISFPMDDTQENIHYINSALNTPVVTTIQDNIRSLGTIDSNYYNTFTDAGIKCEIYDTDGGSLLQSSPYTLDGWRSISNFDVKSKRPAQKIQPYTLINTLGSNVFTNSQFASNISGVTLYGASTTASFDNTGKITGTGSLRMDFAAPQQARYSFIHSAVGAVNASKKYLLRFKMLGTTVNGIVRAYIRKTASPYTILVPIQTKSFGTLKGTQEFLFDGPVTDAGGSFVIEVEQNSGTTYIDDIEFYEANATVNTATSQVRFEYNATSTVKTVVLDAKYIGVDSTVYNGIIDLQPFTAKVMVKAGPVDSLPVANAGPDKNVYLPADSVILNGVGTGSIITGYVWTKISGPAQFAISNTASATTKVTSLVLGTYKFELKVTDNRGFISRDTLSVVVANILPVRLLRFSAIKNEDKVDLKWVTTSEINSQDYVIERRISGREFESIGRVASNNNAGQQSTYRLSDNTPANGTNYYRIKMIDRDGTFTYSNILSVEFKRFSQSFILDNAMMDGSSIKLNISSSKQQTLSIIAVDAAGRVVLKSQVKLQSGTNTLVNNIPAAGKGIYYIKMYTDQDSVIKTLLSE
ncbi:MAG: right-handed parallel beta-helix repeat-containing protein [Chitinophagaceae bacterium]|nr:right-handed parallel beta-helix repeat-containing protein [Chitinophagaceae bacterium]